MPLLITWSTRSVPIRWEKRLRLYMEDALIILKPVQHQVVLKTLPGLASSFCSILDAMESLRLSLRFAETMSVSLFARIISQLKTCYDYLTQFTHHSFYQGIRKKYPRCSHDCLGYFVLSKLIVCFFL